MRVVQVILRRLLSPAAAHAEVELPADFEAHRERLAAAFGKAPEGSSAELSSNSAAFLERAARLSWQRLKLIGEHLENEQKAVAQLFEGKIDPAELLARLVALLTGDAALMRHARQLERQLQEVLYEWLTQQELGPCLEALRPNGKPVTVASTLAELDHLEKQLGLDDEEDEDEG